MPGEREKKRERDETSGVNMSHFEKKNISFKTFGTIMHITQFSRENAQKSVHNIASRHPDVHKLDKKNA